MKLMIGFVAGFAAGAVVYSKLTEDQRAEVSGKVADTFDSLLHTGRTGDVVQTVSSGVGNVADVATERVTEATEAVTSTVADKLGGTDDDAATAT